MVPHILIGGPERQPKMQGNENGLEARTGEAKVSQATPCVGPQSGCELETPDTREMRWGLATRSPPLPPTCGTYGEPLFPIPGKMRELHSAEGRLEALWGRELSPFGQKQGSLLKNWAHGILRPPDLSQGTHRRLTRRAEVSSPEEQLGSAGSPPGGHLCTSPPPQYTVSFYVRNMRV